MTENTDQQIPSKQTREVSGTVSKSGVELNPTATAVGSGKVDQNIALNQITNIGIVSIQDQANRIKALKSKN